MSIYLQMHRNSCSYAGNIIRIYGGSDSSVDDISDLRRDEGEEDEDCHYGDRDEEEEEGGRRQRRQHQRQKEEENGQRYENQN